MLRNRALANDLNLRISQRVSAALACVMALYGALSPFYFGIAGRRLITRLLLPISICTSLIILLNHRLYVFFLRKRGIRFMLAAVPIHLLYYGYSVLAFAVGVGLHVREQYEKPSSER